MGKVLRETIRSHADLQAMQARLQALPTRSDEDMIVDLVSLESVRIARESYVLLRPLMEPRSWPCPQLDLLSIVAGLALELHKVEHDLLPPLLAQQANLERGVLEALLLMKTSALGLLRLEKGYKEAIQEVVGGSLDEEDVVSARVREVGLVLKDTAVKLLEGTHDIVSLWKNRLPWLLERVSALLATPVRFPRVFSDSDSDSDSD